MKSSFAITPKWKLSYHLDLLYLEVDKYAGKIFDLGFKLDYNFWKYGGVGMAADLVYLDYAQDKGGDEFFLEVEQFYVDLLRYAKVFFWAEGIRKAAK